jgi:hypothetical protein
MWLRSRQVREAIVGQLRVALRPYLQALLQDLLPRPTLVAKQNPSQTPGERLGEARPRSPSY